MCQVHDKVEVWDEGGWWEGIVAQVLKTTVKVHITNGMFVISAALHNVRSRPDGADSSKQAPATGKLHILT